MSSLKLLASARSAGKSLAFGSKKLEIEELREDSFDDVDVAFFSAGGAQSRRFAPIAGERGCLVIDNSSAFRMDPEVPLVVPEVNPGALKGASSRLIVANPNCSTIIMNAAVWPLHRAARCSRVVVSTYQAASGAGAQAMAELEQQARDWVSGVEPVTQAIFGRQYVWNLFSHNSAVDAATGYNEEELKMIYETRKIFEEPDLAVSATCVRVPVLRAHCESINVTLESPLEEAAVRQILSEAPGVDLVDDREANKFPEPLDASGIDNVLVGRIRQDAGQPNGYGYELFVAGDQIRKGAALNAIQIAEEVIRSQPSLLRS